jgi:lipoate-protein ligase A
MRLLDHSFDAPELNLALDEAMLDAVERGNTASTLRFWESPTLFAVLGTGQKWSEEVDREVCERNGVPIRRRCSAGGCVLQGVGCLNYALALTHDEYPQVKELRPSYCFILGRICSALHKAGVKAEHAGISDIAVDGFKISGTAQKRKRNSILHHGTLLYAFDAAAMDTYLKHPQAQPDYRVDRSHADFVRQLPLNGDELRALICGAFDVNGPATDPTGAELDHARTLAAEKYATDAWTFRR